MKKPIDRAHLFLNKAQQDAVLVEKIIDDSDIAIETLGFHIEQAFEKALKALLSAHGIPFRRTHDIRELLDLLDDNDLSLPMYFGDLDEWTPFAVEYRYEEMEIESMSFNKSEVLTNLHDVLEWVQNHLANNSE